MATLYPNGPVLSGDGSFTVRRGDSLSLYSQGLYGDFNHVGEFFRSKGPPPAPIPDKNQISEGEKLFHLPPAKDQRIKLALDLISAFEARAGTGAFRQINRGLVAKGLRERVADPTKINQGQAPLCPSACMVFEEAKDRPVHYVDFVTQLYDYGNAWLRKWEIEAGYFLRNYAPPSGTIDVADWIPMASIRDSENWLLPHASVTWDGGAYTSTICQWMRQAGYTSVVDHSSLFFNETESNLRLADTLYRSGHKIIMVIDANVFSSFGSRPTTRKRNHVVVQTSPITFTGPPTNLAIDFKVFTWGSERTMKPDGNLGELLSDFLNYYYGFIAARY